MIAEGSQGQEGRLTWHGLDVGNVGWVKGKCLNE